MTGIESSDARSSIFSRIRKHLSPIDSRLHESKQSKMLLSESELSDCGLAFAGEQSWKIGSRGLAGPEIERAKQRGNLNVWRRFSSQSDKRSVWIQVGEFATTTDAVTFAPILFDSIRQRPGAATEMIESSETVEVPGLSSILVCEERSPYQEGFRGIRVIVGTVDQWLFSIGASAMNDVWAWDDIVSIASAQVQKINARST
jgi:hypothetical protein